MTDGRIRYKVLILGKDCVDIQLICQALDDARERRFSVERCDLISKGLERLKEGGVDLIIFDMNENGSEGLGPFNSISAHAPEVPIVILANSDNEGLAVGAVRRGAQDYLIKGRLSRSSLERYMLQAISLKKKQDKQHGGSSQPLG